jgi:hypothetical protein
MKPHRQRTRFRALISTLVATPTLLLGGCSISTGIPGAPDVHLVPAESTSFKACRQYGEALRDGTSRAEIIAVLRGAQALAESATDDTDAKALADAIDHVLTESSMGTKAGAEIANERVMSLCREAGINMVMVE